jgi:hypothetical protein
LWLGFAIYLLRRRQETTASKLSNNSSDDTDDQEHQKADDKFQHLRFAYPDFPENFYI